jgi:hypothetical protein
LFILDSRLWIAHGFVTAGFLHRCMDGRWILNFIRVAAK